MYKAITNRSVTVSEMVWLSETLLKLVKIIQNMTSDNREGSWVGHLQTILDIPPLPCQIESSYFHQYFSLSLEIILKEYLSMFKEFSVGKFVVKTSTGFFNAVVLNIKLKQSIQRYKKGAGVTFGKENSRPFWLNGK